MENLPDKLYNVDSIVRLEQIAINQYSIPAYELMRRAGDAVYDVLLEKYPGYKKILVLCGAGNNAGDGYVVATLAKRADFNVSVISLADPLSLKGEASLAYQEWQTVGENIIADDALMNKSLIEKADIIVDALLGTGLTRDVSSEWQSWIALVNKSRTPVIAVDVPSGLIPDTGVIAGTAIKADVTVCFIGLKKGMFTAQAKDVCGEIVFDDLDLPGDVYSNVEADATLINTINYSLLPERKPSSHKGQYGHVLIVGGNTGMPGAIILAAKAALRTGAGLVTVVTVAENLEVICSAVPEAMVKTCDVDAIADVLTDVFIKKITHIAIGMGLGQSEWSLALLRFCLALDKPMLLDADALNLIALHKLKTKMPVVITPHPGEAAALLSAEAALSSADVQKNRFDAVKKLYDVFHCDDNNVEHNRVVILKGSGTLIFDGQTIKVCALGNAAMAAPGMGDVLSGIVVALMAQKINISDAAELAVCIHASAAQRVTGDKSRGLLASDVVDELKEIVR